jgi:uncharacterized protein (TIGR02172 family)
MELIGRGRTADVYAWDDGRVVKLFHEWMSQESIDHEARICQIVYEAGVKSPRIDDTISVEGRRGIVYERLDGTSMLAELRQRPWQMIRWARVMGELHAAMHASTAPDLPSLKESMRWKIERIKIVPEAIRQMALDQLDHLPEGDRVCHGDFHPDNILITGHGPIVIDWNNACAGDPAADVARTSLLFQIGRAPDTSWLMARLEDGLRHLSHRTYLRRYSQCSTITPEQIAAWALPVWVVRAYEGITDEHPTLLARIETLTR